MEFYPTHHRHKEEFKRAVREASEIVDEMVELFQRTQPSSMSMETVGGTRREGTDKIDQYLIEKERKQIDARLKAAREICDELRRRLDDDERCLQLSQELTDRVYYCQRVQKMGVPEIASRLHYTQSYVYAVIREIEKKLQNS